MMLKGKALQERARELNIPGRSKMSADELRQAVEQYETVESVRKAVEQRDAVEPAGRVTPTPLTFHDRLAVYLETNNTEHTFNDDAPKLTHRQRRRLRKKARKNGGA